MYSPELLDHFRNPRNVGVLSGEAATVEVTNPACGDVLRLSATVENGVITGAAYQVRGCTASIAAGSCLTELIKSRSVDEAARLSARDIADCLGGLPPESGHAAVLAIDALRSLLTQVKA
jgi:NifU-like protein involved in Fe-S cluster formation